MDYLTLMLIVGEQIIRFTDDIVYFLFTIKI